MIESSVGMLDGVSDRVPERVLTIVAGPHVRGRRAELLDVQEVHAPCIESLLVEAFIDRDEVARREAVCRVLI